MPDAPQISASAPRALLLKFPGTNCDAETARALSTVGFDPVVVPFGAFEPSRLDGVSLLVFPGGFSYGDYVMAGRLAQLELERTAAGCIREFVQGGGHVLGICNGFQILTKLGILPPGSLVDNTSGRFQCRWVGLENRAPDNPFLRHLPAQFELPIAHAEGRFVIDDDTAQRYLDEGLVPLVYAEGVNGSARRIAALQDATGRVLGLMPHPERFLRREHHYDPEWDGAGDGWGWGHVFFRSIHEEILNLTTTGVS